MRAKWSDVADDNEEDTQCMMDLFKGVQQEEEEEAQAVTKKAKTEPEVTEEAMAGLRVTLESMQAVAVSGLQDMVESLRDVYHYHGSRATFNRVSSSTQARQRFVEGAVKSVSKAVTNEGGNPRRFLMALSSCVELLDACVSDAEAVKRLTDAGFLTAPPGVLVRLVEKGKVWHVR